MKIELKEESKKIEKGDIVRYRDTNICLVIHSDEGDEDDNYEYKIVDLHTSNIIDEYENFQELNCSESLELIAKSDEIKIGWIGPNK